jgi:hypothetical protein
MKKTAKVRRTSDGMRTRYDFSTGVRGRYAARFRTGTNLMRLEPDVAKAFPNSRAVNRALRTLLDSAPRKRERRQKRTA